MSSEIEGPYDPQKTEEKIYKTWEKSGFFEPKGKGGPYTIVIPPPNITGSLHMGHALNATIQDILIRKKRMEGRKVLWLPGTDHAGIATQNVVEKQLKKEGKNRHDLGREKFIERVWEWKEEYGNRILNQLKSLGASCDWTRTAFTMDEGYQEWVKKVFLHYQEKGWIYRAERVINWCPRCQTSLSDLELEYKEEKGKLYFIKYPLKEAPTQSRDDKNFIFVATTRPETMLGDTAVAVNPKDERYKKLIGQKVTLPLVGKKIPIIADRAVDPEFGTGAVKVTPAHSIIDSEMGENHKLPFVKVIDQFGKMSDTDEAKNYSGMKTKEAREKIAGDLKKQNLIDKEEDYTHNVATCYRCNRTVENIPSMQWFLKMNELAKVAIEAVKSGKVKFHPKKWEKIYLDWLSNIKDWCVSRQIWWGHKVPVEGSEDVLDTWFSSALWPFATMNDKDRKEFYPTNVLSTARDIINLWVARMVFSGIEFMDKEPFEDVIIHPTILTKDGKRMSKSLGTGVDPMDYIEKYGADATRFGLIWQMLGAQDMHWAEEHVLAGKKFANKLWNIARFVLQQNENFQFFPISEGNRGSSILQIKIGTNSKLQNDDKEILGKLEKLLKKTDKNIGKYKFGQALHDIYDFVWKEFADKYIEHAKTREDDEVKQVLSFTLVNILKLLHPFMPFVTEEIWSKLPLDKKELLMATKL